MELINIEEGYTIEFKRKIYPENILAVIKEVYDGTCDYWMEFDENSFDLKNKPKGSSNTEWITDLLTQNKSIIIIEKQEETEIARYELTIEKLINGFKMGMENSEIFWDIDDIDSDISDMIMQYALFEEIRYDIFDDDDYEDDDEIIEFYEKEDNA